MNKIAISMRLRQTVFRKAVERRSWKPRFSMAEHQARKKEFKTDLAMKLAILDQAIDLERFSD